jgi:hypothetical protein
LRGSLFGKVFWEGKRAWQEAKIVSECVQKDEKEPIEKGKRRTKPKRAFQGEAICAYTVESDVSIHQM